MNLQVVDICRSISDHKMQYYLVLLIIIIRMKKKDNNGSVQSSYNILHKIASECFERKNIDQQMITAFNNFIFNFADAFTKNNPAVATIDNLKLAVQLINVFEANLADDFARHTCAFDEIVSLFTNLILLADKIDSAWKDPERFICSDIINVFSFVLEQKSEECKLPALDKKIQILNSVIQSHQIYVVDRSSVQFLIKSSFSFVSFSGNNKDQLKNMLVCFLRNPSQNDNFKKLLLKYLNQCILSNNVVSFKKAISIYQHFGSSFEQRRANLQMQTLKILQTSNTLPFIMEINSLYTFTKLFSVQNSLKVIVKTIQRIIQKPNINGQATQILQELSQLSLLEIHNNLFDKLQLKLETFLVRIIDWVINQSINPIVKKQNIEEKALVQAEQKEEKLIQFVKKLSHKPYQESSEANLQLQKICKALSKILNKLIQNEEFRTRLRTLTIDSFPFLRSDRITNPIVKMFILQVIPNILVEFDLDFKDKSPLVYAVVLKRAQIEAQQLQQNRSQMLEKYFRQTYFQMVNPQSLNYHFIACFTFIKHLDYKDSVISIIFDQILRDLSKNGTNKSNRNLIINMALLLKLLYAATSFLPIKFKTKQLMKNTEDLSLKLDVGQILTVWAKQISIQKANIQAHIDKFKQLYTLLNEQLNNYSRDNPAIFYSLVIGISDMIEKQKIRNLKASDLVQEIKFVRKVSFLTQMFTLTRSFLQVLAFWESQKITQQKKVVGFVILCKMLNQTKNKPLELFEDLPLLLQKLKEYLIQINSNISTSLLATLDNFKNNKNNYRDDKFMQYLSSKDFIRFYSQASQDQNVTHVLMMKNGLKLIRKIMEAQNIPINNLQEQIKTLFLIYLFEESPPSFGFTDRHETHLKQYVLLLLLRQKIEQKQDLMPILGRLQMNLSVIKELILERHEGNLIRHFKTINPFSFADICVSGILNAFTSFERQDVLLLRFIIQLVEDDKKDNCVCLKTFIQTEIQSKIDCGIMSQAIKRIKMGLQLQEKKKAQFLSDSFALYQLLGHQILQYDKLQALVEDIIQIDCYSQVEESAFLLKEIANIFSVVEIKSPLVCQTIFNYIITLTEVFQGQEKLQIATFICNFFGLKTTSTQGSLQGLERSVVLQCNNNQASYKCLKCDDKRLLCVGCSLACHKDHPVCFLSIPSEIKISRCQCRQIPACCTFKKDSGEIRNKIKSQFPPPINHYSPSYLGGRDFMQRIKYVAPPRQQLDDPQPFNSHRFDFNQLMQQQQYDRIEQEMMGSRYYEQIIKDDYVPRMGARIDRLFERDQLPPGYRAQIDRNRSPAQNNPFSSRQKEKQSIRQDECEVVQPEFIDEQYQQDQVKMEIQESNTFVQNTEMLKKYALLPKFIDLMINFCSKKATKDKNVSNLQLWSPVFNSPVVQKIMAVSVRVHNPGSYHLDVRRQNPLNNVSCVLIKRNLAFNNRFFIIASGTDLLVYNKEKLFVLASQGKAQGFNSIHRHSISYEIHTIQFSPNDKNIFCASGLHNLAIFTLSNEGGITRSQSRYNINNLYINKIKLAKMGIFVGVDKEIRVLSYLCKHTLTIKAQQANTLIRQWSIYQKASGCQAYFVCPNGNIFFADILPSDQGKKDFTGRVNDQRKNKNSTGASVFVKDLPDIGKQLFASFKDGSNILGRLQGDQMQNMTDIRLKGYKVDKNIFDSFFIVGHVDLVKLPIFDEVYLICTVKKYFPPEMSFHQGFLAVIRMRKDGTSELQIVNDQSTCQSFQVFYIGNKHFFILSLHTDGSLHLNSPTKIPRNVVDEEIKRSKENQQSIAGSSNEIQPDAIDKIRRTIQNQIKFDQLQTTNLSSSYLFRQSAQSLKPTLDYMLNKLGENQYELKQINFTKVITGFSLPQFGTVDLPTRTLTKVFEVGFTNLQALYFFAHGSLRFKYTKNQAQKFTREHISLINNRMLEKIERIQKFSEYSQHQRLLHSNMISNFLNIKEDVNQDIIFVGRSFENFKSKISKFDKMFAIDSDEQSSSIEKTALIIKMFLSKSLKQGHQCEQEPLVELVNSIKSIIPDANKKLSLLLKQIVVIAMKVYEQLTGKTLNLYTDQNYGLKAATETRLQYFYSMLKLDIGDQELNDLLDLLVDIINEDLGLFSYYCAKYPGIIAQLHRRLKKPDTEARAQSILKIYSLAYPILDYCQVPCAWVLGTITQIIYAFIKNKAVRDSFYEGLRLSKYLVIEPALKSLGNKQSEVEDLQLLKNVQQALIEEQAPKDPVTQIYMMFSRGQIDEDAMFRMIQDATKILYEKAQQINEKPQQNQLMQAEQQRQMQENMEQVEHQLTLVYDLIDQCTEGFEGDLQVSLSRIATLYVVSKVVDKYFQDLTGYMLDKIYKMVNQIDIKCQNQKLVAVLSYSCLFNRIITSSVALKREGYKSHIAYRNIEIEVNSKLSKIQLQNVQKIKHPLNLLPLIFRGEKPAAQAHVAYALTNFLIYPCEPSHVLLSLECYWLLPNSKESYRRQKCESSIRDGINSGNLIKVYQIVKQNAQIWQQSGEYLQLIYNWIDKKNLNWQLALQLLAIYYQK